MCIILWELEITRRFLNWRRHLRSHWRAFMRRWVYSAAPDASATWSWPKGGMAQGWRKSKKKNVLMGKSSINDINDGSSIARFVTLKNKNIWIELEQQCFSLAIEKGNLESEDHVIMPKHDLRPWNSWASLASLVSSFEVAAIKLSKMRIKAQNMQDGTPVPELSWFS